MKFDQQGLIPAIIQDYESREVLMLAYMNKASFRQTLLTGETYFYSRSRQCLWHKGETSGNIQKVRRIRLDCDQDTLLIEVDQSGSACHTGSYSCFFDTVQDKTVEQPLMAFLRQLYAQIEQRQQELPENSYTTKLFTRGGDYILQKVIEESGEVVLAAKNNKAALREELVDLIYHLLVLLVQFQVSPAELSQSMQARQQKIVASRQ